MFFWGLGFRVFLGGGLGLRVSGLGLVASVAVAHAKVATHAPQVKRRKVPESLATS